MKHTPGPLTSSPGTGLDRRPAGAGLHFIKDVNGVLVASVYRKGDAQLFAAAPEMHNELFRALAVIRNPQAFDKDAVCNDIQRVLRKAEEGA